MNTRKLVLCSIMAILLAPISAMADNFPQRPIKLVVPWAAGGNTDGIGRLVAERLSAQIGQQVVVENKPGANGIVGTTMVARSKPDGYTLMLALPETNVLNPLVYRNINYTAKDLDAVAFVGVMPFALVSRPNMEANTLAELVRLAQKDPGAISAFSWGVGSTAHTAIALMEQAANVSLLHVPFPGTAPALTQLIGGQGDLMFLSAERAATYAKRGEVKVLGVTSPKRMAAYPELPTFAEQGFPDVDVALWYGISAPSNTPAEVKEFLAKAMGSVLQEPAVLENLTNRGVVVQPKGPAEFSKFINDEDARWSKVIKDKNIHVDN